MNNANNFFNNNKILNSKPKGGPPMALMAGGFLFVIVLILVAVWYMKSSPAEQDCELSEWSSWKNCGSGDSCPSGKNRVRTRTVVTEPSENGKDCGDLTEYKNDCDLSEWSSWRACDDGECAIGKNEIRTREAEDGDCEGKSLVEYRYELPTPVDCITGSWSNWAPCGPEDNCPSGKNEIRTRGMDQEPNSTGRECGALAEYRYVAPTVPVNCQVSAWSEWQPCTTADECTGEYRERTVLSNENELGSCPERNNLKETRNVPVWGSGKICGETTGTYCLMPFGAPCASGKDIPKDLPNGGRCKEAVREVAEISGFQSYRSTRVPKNCSYQKTDSGAHVVGHGSSWSSTPFSEHMAVCLN
jgi:hypothetical protein